MREKRFAVVTLLGVALLLTTLFGFAGTAPPRVLDESVPPAAAPETTGAPSAAATADKSLIFEASPQVRRVGAGIGEAPAVPGTFHFDLGVPIETVTRAYLSYELAGVPHWTAAVRPIHGLPLPGGFGSPPASGMALQVEEINPHWLRGGNNEVMFLPVGTGDRPPIGVARVGEGSAPAGAAGGGGGGRPGGGAGPLPRPQSPSGGLHPWRPVLGAAPAHHVSDS